MNRIIWNLLCAFFGWLVALLLIVLLFKGLQSVNAAPASLPHPMDLFGFDVFNTDPFPCGQQFHSIWKNDGRPMYIHQAQLWMGMYPGNRSDFGYQVHRTSDGSLMFRGNWDHYADPTGIRDQIHFMNFSPDYMYLDGGDSLELWYKCQNVGDVGHIIVTLWVIQ